LLGLFFDPEFGGDIFLQKLLLTLSGLHGVISQKTVLFITTAVRTSNPVSVQTISNIAGAIFFVSFVMIFSCLVVYVNEGHSAERVGLC
jgi:NhaP-type Na+/H+ or K+/H+ antiporter